MLERYFAKYEFSAPYLLSCSDAEPLTLKELLSMGDRETRALWENLLFGLSKSFSLPGLRVGWLISRDLKLIEDIKSYKDYTTIRGSAPSEVLAIIALRARETILARNRAIISHNLQILDKFFREHDLFSPGINHATEQLVFRNYCWISLLINSARNFWKRKGSCFFPLPSLEVKATISVLALAAGICPKYSGN